MLQKIKKFVLADFWKIRPLIWLVLFANLLGSFYGFLYFYKDQLLGSPLWQWIFIPDSPLYTFLFSVVLTLFLLKKKKESNLLNLITFVGLIKIGLWTLIVIPLYRDYFLSPDNYLWFVFLAILHLGMILEAFTLFKRIKFNELHLAIALSWFFLGDLSDYFLFQTMPRAEILATNLANLSVLRIESLASTILILLAVVHYSSASKTGTS